MKVTQAVKIGLLGTKELLWVDLLIGLLDGNIAPVVCLGCIVPLAFSHEGAGSTMHPPPSRRWAFTHVVARRCGR